MLSQAFDLSSSIGIIIALIVAFGGAGGLVALFTIPQSRRRMGAETHNYEISSSVSLSTAALAQMTAAIERSNDLSDRIEELEEDREERRIRDIEHERWDREAYESLHALNVNIRFPPPLNSPRPPTHHDREN